MSKPIQLIYFLKFFAGGIIVPILSLMLLAHGATIENISLVIGLFSVTVILSEFPSGVFADLYGRKTSFLLSSVLSLVSYGLILFSRSISVLLLGMVVNGLSRAFSSGSIEALLIDHAAEHGCPLERVTARLSILESAGLASGALVGGLLAEFGECFSVNLVVNLAITAVILVLTALFVKEAPRNKAEHVATTHRQLFQKQVKESLSFAKLRGTVRILLIFFLLMGFSLSAIEVYWQPALQTYQPVYWLFGAVTFAGFAFVMFGSWVAERLLRAHPNAGLRLLLLLKAPLGIALILFSFSRSEYSLIGLYLGLYLLIGSSSVVESTLLNQFAPSSHRASILSLFSLVLQIGGVLASICGYLVSTYFRYQNIWLLAGVLLFLFSVGVGLFQRRSKAATVPSDAENTPDESAEIPVSPEREQQR
ncbi:MAG: MFS transporter [Eubacteriales bacterium]|nr:MFS transporter [Eubacteriales bacterium]